MTERESFLERWSRKKTEAQRDAAEASPDTPAVRDAPPTPNDAADVSSKESAPRPETALSSPAAPKPEFDLASLPSLDSITAATDIRGFLAPGVPPELTHAALRRVWMADPAIRDFVGLQENDWDFTNPAAVPGFSEMPAGYDVKKVIAEIFGEAKPSVEPLDVPESPQPRPARPQDVAAPESTTPTTSVLPTNEPESVTPSVRLSTPAEETDDPANSKFVQCNTNTAAQQQDRSDESEQLATHTPRRRQHGGALPQS
jgi:hypothetical protein